MSPSRRPLRAPLGIVEAAVSQCPATGAVPAGPTDRAAGKWCEGTLHSVLMFCMSKGERTRPGRTVRRKCGSPRQHPCAGGGIGRRAGFRFQCPKGRGGSTPPSRTERERVSPGDENHREGPVSRCPEAWPELGPEFGPKLGRPKRSGDVTCGTTTDAPGMRREYFCGRSACTTSGPARGVRARRSCDVRRDCGVSRRDGRRGPWPWRRLPRRPWPGRPRPCRPARPWRARWRPGSARER